MSYALEAYLAPLSALEGAQKHKVPGVYYRLTDALALIPLCGGQDLPFKWPVEASENATIARVSAEYFGGHGSQKATVWRDGEVIAEEVEVNEALRHFGVVKSGGDEWDTVGLDRYRRTETWASEAIREKRNRDGLSLEKLLQALRYTSSNKKLQRNVRAGAADDLGELGDAAAVPDLVEAVRDRDRHSIDFSAARALARIGGPGLAEIGKYLREMMAAPAPKRRWFRKAEPEPFDYFAILKALGEAGAAAGPYAGDVAELLQQDHTRARSDAAQALEKMGPAAAVAVPALIQTLDDEHSFIRSYAAQALGAIGPAAAPAIETLTACLDDEEHYVRESAEAALAAINGSASPD